MNKLKTAILALLIMITFTGCSINGSNNDIIKVDNTVITQKDYQKSFDILSEGMLKSLGINPAKDPNNIMVLMAKQQAISQLIINTILNNEIKKLNITVSKEELDNAEKEIASKFQDKNQFIQVLKANGVTYDDFRKNLENEVKIKKYVDSIAMVSVGEAEAKKFYDKNPDKFSYPKQVKASHILISANPDKIKAEITADNKQIPDIEVAKLTDKKMKEQKEKAEAILAKLKANPSSFSKIAKESSDDTASAVKGGDLGFFTKDEMVPEFAKAAFSLKPNTVSGIVQTPYGYHIIMVTDRKEAGKYSFAETKNEIIALLENQDKMTIFKDKITELGKNAKIEYLDENYNPEIIQKKIQEAAKSNPDLQKMMETNAAAQKEG